MSLELKDLRAAAEGMMASANVHREICREHGWDFDKVLGTEEYRDAICEWLACKFKKWERFKGQSVGTLHQRAVAAAGGCLIYVGLYSGRDQVTTT